MNEQPEQSEDDDFDAEEIMQEHWGKYPDLDFTWEWLHEMRHEIFLCEREARDSGDDKRAEFEMTRFFTVSCLCVRVAEQVLDRIKDQEANAYEKLALWSAKVGI